MCCKPFKRSIISFDDVFREFKFISNSVNISSPKTISYLPLGDSSTWNLHVTTLVALSAGKAKSALTLISVVIFPAYLCHCIGASISGATYFTSFPITTVELHSMFSNIRNVLNLTLPFLVFIHPCRIRE